MTRFRGEIEQTSGIPLGGIGTGTVEVRVDGYFHDWQIFNLGRWAPRQPEGTAIAAPDLPPGALSFYVRTARGGEAPLMRRLGLRTDQNNLYSLPWLKPVEAIEFEGRFPLARLRYDDAALPVEVSAEMCSPFVPHDSRTSGTPGFYAAFRVRNRSDRPVDVTLAAALRNPVSAGAVDAQRINTVRRAGDTTRLTLRTRAVAPALPTLGSLCLGVQGGEASWVLGDYWPFLSDIVWIHSDAYGVTAESALDGLRATGRLPSLGGGTSPNDLVPQSDGEIDGLSPAAARRLFDRLNGYAFFRAVADRVRSVEPGRFRTTAGIREFLKDAGRRLQRVAGKDRAGDTWGDAALASTLTLAPLEERVVVFMLGWHFPNHFSARGPVLGHMYEHWFGDAEDVVRFLASNHDALRPRVVSFADTLYATSLPEAFPDAWSGQLSTIAKCTWWTKDGKFAVWEGLGCCGFHTTDITYQGSFNLLALFPDLQRRQMLMGARYQRADGRVHHFFTPDLSAVDNGFDRVDMNQQFVLLVARDYLWTGDRAYLRRAWPHIVKAMRNTEQLDGDGDGLPDRDTRRNTYDAWNFRGTPSYIASLWLSALLAAIRLAEDLGRRGQAARWRRLLARGVASFERTLWNGEYYSLWVDDKTRDECCMTDQIDGEWFTGLVGLGHALPRERIVAALRAVMRWNYSDEGGLINASYPPGRKVQLSTFRNAQAAAPWTGIEYAIGSMMLEAGLVAEGSRVVANIHERYRRAGRFWNHVECGDHYYRAMSSWAVLLAATGFKIDVPRETLTVQPATGGAPFRAPWVAATGWGSLEQSAARFALSCRSGSLAFRTLRIGPGAGDPVVRLNGRPLRVRCVARQDGRELRFARRVALRAGDCLLAGD